MKIKFEQLRPQLKKNSSSIYWVTGDEPWLIMQAQQLIRSHAQQLGFCERELLFEDKDFAWDILHHKAAHAGLFAEKILIELRLQTTKLNEAGAQAIIHYCEHLP